MNIANKITMLRIVLTFIFMFFLSFPFKGAWVLWAKVLSLVIFTFAALSDFFDGMIANKKNMVTDFGKLMDPIADKVLVLTIIVVMILKNDIPLWLASFIIFRDIAILLGGILIKKLKGIVLVSNYWGKWAVSAIALYIVMTITDISYPEIILVVIVTALLTISFGTYIYRAYKIFFMNEEKIN